MLIKSVIALAFVATLSLTAAAPRAENDSTPKPVSAWFESEALTAVSEADADSVTTDNSETSPLASASGVSKPIELYRWSKEFVTGAATEKPYVATGLWIAALLDAEGNAIGIVEAMFQPGDAVASFAGYGLDSDLQIAVLNVGDKTLLVRDDPSGGLFAVEGDSVSPLNKTASVELPTTKGVKDYQSTISQRYAKADRDSAQYDGTAVGGSGVLPASPLPGILSSAGVLLAGLLVAGIAVFGLRRGSRGRATAVNESVDLE